MFFRQPPKVGQLTVVAYSEVSGNSYCSFHFVNKTSILLLHLIGTGRAGKDQQTIAKRHRLSRFKGEVELLFAIAENFLTQRVSSEKAVPARMPVSREADVFRMVKHHKRDGFLIDF